MYATFFSGLLVTVSSCEQISEAGLGHGTGATIPNPVSTENRGRTVAIETAEVVEGGRLAQREREPVAERPPGARATREGKSR